MSYHRNVTFALPINTASSTPLASQNYYFANDTPSTITSGTAATRRLTACRPCTITDVVLYFSYTNGTNENTSLYIRKNNTTDTTVSTTLQFDGTTTALRVSGLNVPLATDDFFCLKLSTPAWVGAPTSFVVYGYVLLSTGH